MASNNATLQIIIDAQNNASKVLSQVSKDVEGLGGRFSTEWSMIKGVAGIAEKGILALGAAIGAAGVYSLKSASNFEQYSIAFETMLGNADKAKSLMNDIVETAKKTPFQLDELVVSSKQLLAYGFAQEDVIRTTTMLGDVSAGLNLNLSDMAWLYGTTRVQGRLFSKDLYQFTNRGIPLTAELAKQFKVTETEVQKLVEAGKVGFPDVEKAFQSMTGEGGKFYNLMLKQSTTLGGLMSNLKDSFSILGMEIVGVTATGEIIKGGLFDKVKEGAIALYNWIDANKEMLKTYVTDAIQTAITKFTQWYDSVGGAQGIISALQRMWSTIQNEVLPVLLSVITIIGQVTTFLWQHREAVMILVAAYEAIKIALVAQGVIQSIVNLGTAISGSAALMGVMSAVAIPALLLAVTGLTVYIVAKTIQAYQDLQTELNGIRKASDEVTAALGRYNQQLGQLKTSEANQNFEKAIKLTQNLQKETDTLASRYKGFGGVINSVFDAWLDKQKQTLSMLGKLIDKVKEYNSKSNDSKSGRAVGGSVTSGKAYMVGENGPEMFVPSSNGRIEKNPQASSTIHINFNNAVVRSDADLDAIVRAVKQSLNNETRLAQYGVAI